MLCVITDPDGTTAVASITLHAAILFLFPKVGSRLVAVTVAECVIQMNVIYGRSFLHNRLYDQLFPLPTSDVYSRI